MNAETISATQPGDLARGVAYKKRQRTPKGAKLADYYVGVPLVAVLGTLRRLMFGRRPVPGEIKRIALLMSAAIGDTLLMSSVWGDLRQSFPGAQITAFVGETNYEISCVLFGEQNVCLLPVKRPWESLRICRRQSVDVLLDFGPWPRWNALLALAMPARWRAGYKTKGQYRHYGYDLPVVHSSSVHEMENHRALAASLNIATTHLPEIPARAFAGAQKDPDLARRVILHAWPSGFRHRYREWPTEHWVELARRLVAHGYSVELSGGSGDRPHSAALAREMEAVGVAVTDYAGKMPLAEFIRRLPSVLAVISIDTGVMHLAAVAGVLTIGLHGPSQAKRWGARGKRAYAIETPCPGCGFLDLGFEYPAIVPPCMAGITVDRVWSEFLLRVKEGD